MTFGLVYCVHSLRDCIDSKKGNLGIIVPITIGFVVGANILVGGAFDGASMNPAVYFEACFGGPTTGPTGLAHLVEVASLASSICLPLSPLPRADSRHCLLIFLWMISLNFNFVHFFFNN